LPATSASFKNNLSGSKLCVKQKNSPIEHDEPIIFFSLNIYSVFLVVAVLN